MVGLFEKRHYEIGSFVCISLTLARVVTDYALAHMTRHRLHKFKDISPFRLHCHIESFVKE